MFHTGFFQQWVIVFFLLTKVHVHVFKEKETQLILINKNNTVFPIPRMYDTLLILILSTQVPDSECIAQNYNQYLWVPLMLFS